MYSSLWDVECHSPQLLRLYTQGVRAVLAYNNLAVCATIVEVRGPHVPCASYPVLQLFRGSLRLYERLLSTPAFGTLIYAIVHVYMPLTCTGKTISPLLQALRKHDVAATACAEESSFQEVFRIAGRSEWTLVPMQITTDEKFTCFLERGWWYRPKCCTWCDVHTSLPRKPLPLLKVLLDWSNLCIPHGLNITQREQTLSLFEWGGDYVLHIFLYLPGGKGHFGGNGSLFGSRGM